MEADICLIELESSFELNSAVGSARWPFHSCLCRRMDLPFAYFFPAADVFVQWKRRLPLSGQNFTGEAIVAGWGATLEGGQIDGTLLSASVSRLFYWPRWTTWIGRCNFPWKVNVCTSTWSLKVPLVDHEECKTIYGEALYQVKGKVSMCTGSIIIVTWVHNILNVCSHSLSVLDQIIWGHDVRGWATCRRLSGQLSTFQSHSTLRSQPKGVFKKGCFKKPFCMSGGCWRATALWRCPLWSRLLGGRLCLSGRTRALVRDGNISWDKKQNSLLGSTFKILVSHKFWMSGFWIELPIRLNAWILVFQFQGFPGVYTSVEAYLSWLP